MKSQEIHHKHRYPEIESMTSELQKLRTENIELKAEMDLAANKFDKQYFDGKNDRVLYFTGLQTFHILLALYTFLEPALPVKKTVNKFKMLILTLMRLRLNVSASFLAYEFNVSSATVSRIFSVVIDVMYVRMKPLVFWPSRHDIRKTMSMQFRKCFGTTCAVIIDCFEIFIDRPTNLKARAETWSSYKHHNTVKFLIGITPQGTVSFISNAWGGRVSDKHVTENYGFFIQYFPWRLGTCRPGF